MPKRPTRLAAILSGEDWSDAGVAHIMIPDKLDVETALGGWNEWYTQIFSPSLRGDRKERYLSFADWLVERCDASYATEDEILIIHD